MRRVLFPAVIATALSAVAPAMARGPVYGHSGGILGYVSSLRHYADHGVTVSFQINTDVGVIDDRTDLVPALETTFANIAIEAVE